MLCSQDRVRKTNNQTPYLQKRDIFDSKSNCEIILLFLVDCEVEQVLNRKHDSNLISYAHGWTENLTYCRKQ